MPPDSVLLPRLGLVMPLASQQGGAERLFQTLLHVQSRLFEYRVLFLQEGPLVAEARNLGYETTVLQTTHLRDLRNYADTVRRIRLWIKQSHLNLVFSWMLKGHLYAGPASILLAVKRMWFQHGIAGRHWMNVVGTCLPANAILCCSNYVKRTQGSRFLSAPTFVCYPGVKLPSERVLSKATARDRLGLPPSGQVICMVARLERWKGVHVFIQAAALLARDFPEAVFCVAGGSHPLDHDYSGYIQQVALHSLLGDRLRLLGQLPPSHVVLLHASSDIIVHPVTEAEPFGMAIVEALAMGRAVVSSNTGGITEILEDGVSGMFVPPGDVGALAEAISRLLANVEVRERLEAASLIRAQNFSVEAFTTRFESLVASVLAS